MTLVRKQLLQQLSAAVLATGLLVGPVAAQQKSQEPADKRDLPAKLVKEAKVSETDAAKTALARVPKGHIQAVELEERGRQAALLVRDQGPRAFGHRGSERRCEVRCRCQHRARDAGYRTQGSEGGEEEGKAGSLTRVTANGVDVGRDTGGRSHGIPWR